MVPTRKYRVAVIGGGGYTAGELLRILAHHPYVRIGEVVSQSQSAKKIAEVHPDLTGDTELRFVDQLTEPHNVYFLCMGHGHSGDFLSKNDISKESLLIDLSNEYRLKSSEHDFTYGLPELQREKIKESLRIANPGCFATAIQLGFLPLAFHGLISDVLHVQAITGSTGAGQKPSPTAHFSWRNNNISIYKAFRHQHEPEILQSLNQLQPFVDKEIVFLPMRGDFTRGIFSSQYTRFEGSIEEATELYIKYYAKHPFVHISNADVHLKQVVNTNKVLLQLRKHNNILHITSIMDNLTKGASGQAVQNMNLALGMDEEEGLKLKANYF